MSRPPGLSDAEHAIAVLQQAAELNRGDPLRRGSLLEFPEFGQVVMTGDMHGNRRNFEKLCRYASLERASARHVMLHELIHQEVTLGQADTSYELLIEAAEYKCRFPDQVHFLQSNHELAQLTGQRISKGGHDVIENFNEAVITAYGGLDGMGVLEAIRTLIASYPLAARTPNRVWLSHSLPSDRDMESFDPAVVQRTDFHPLDRGEGGSVYALVWGRMQSARLLADLAQAWDVDLFITGHQPQDQGYEVVHNRLLILASEHNHGTFLPIDLGKPQTIETLTENIRKFVEVA